MRPGLRLAACAALLCASPALAQHLRADRPPIDIEPVQPDASAPFGLDPAHTRFGFDMRTRWGQQVSGRFPEYEGEVTVLPDGRHQVHIRLATGAVEVGDSPRYTAMARGEGFFDAQRHPTIEFVSDPHTSRLVRDGGPLRGRLSMHGVSRVETFEMAPSQCERPGRGCDVVARGSISRADYRLDGWKLLLGDRVHFRMRVRLADVQPVHAQR